ncbi:hypothetical protein BDD12DRAFT_846392 [Trichophaea hybrida]|nr:hypothetical protein BDD12DRAFT_846392 [Trichophaea hybrida]
MKDFCFYYIILALYLFVRAFHLGVHCYYHVGAKFMFFIFLSVWWVFRVRVRYGTV